MDSKFEELMDNVVKEIREKDVESEKGNKAFSLYVLTTADGGVLCYSIANARHGMANIAFVPIGGDGIRGYHDLYVGFLQLLQQLPNPPKDRDIISKNHVLGREVFTYLMKVHPANLNIFEVGIEAEKRLGCTGEPEYYVIVCDDINGNPPWHPDWEQATPKFWEDPEAEALPSFNERLERHLEEERKIKALEKQLSGALEGKHTIH